MYTQLRPAPRYQQSHTDPSSNPKLAKNPHTPPFVQDAYCYTSAARQAQKGLYPGPAKEAPTHVRSTGSAYMAPLYLNLLLLLSRHRGGKPATNLPSSRVHHHKRDQHPLTQCSTNPQETHKKAKTAHALSTATSYVHPLTHADETPHPNHNREQKQRYPTEQKQKQSRTEQREFSLIPNDTPLSMWPLRFFLLIPEMPLPLI